MQARGRQEKWPEHRRFFEAVGEVLGHYGTPEEIALDGDRVAAWRLADLSPLVRGEVVVVPKFVTRGRKAPATTIASWLNALPNQMRADYPGAIGILLTNSLVTAQERPSFRVWDREFLAQCLQRGHAGFEHLAEFLPGDAIAGSLAEGSMDTGSLGLEKAAGRVRLSVEVDGFGWRRAADAFVLPVGTGGAMNGATARAFLEDVGPSVGDDIQRGRPEFFSIDKPYTVALPPPYTPLLIVATAYGDDIRPETAFISAIRLAAEHNLKSVVVPLMGAAQLGDKTALRRMLDAVPDLPRVAMDITLVVLDKALAELARWLIGKMWKREDDQEPGVASAQGTFPLPSVAASFTNDAAEGVDLLGVDKQAESFAQLLAAQKVRMPLAIGLFGNWGSGKSFFMHLIGGHLDALRRGPRASDATGGGVYYRGVAAITFNAWHYTDSELWPSLALRIFDGVAAFMAGEDKTDTDTETIALRQKLAREVASNERARGEAEQALVAAKEQRGQVLAELQEAEEERGTSADRLRFASLGNELLKDAAPILSAAGLPQASASLKQAEQALADARHIMGKLTFMFPWRWPGQWLPWVLAGLTLLVVTAAFGIHALVGKHLDGQIAGMLAALTPFAAMGGEVVRRLGNARKTTDELAALLDKARKAATEKAAVDGKGEALNACDSRIAAARARLTQCDQAIADASRRLQEIEAGGLVYDFLRERAGDERYRSRLGVVSMLRQDLESLQRKLKTLENVAADDGAPRVVPVRRIVLFVDDLDRCEPDRVVDVLQAVHLLLAFPLFAVIVAVDPRWLERSLYKRYLPGFETMTEEARTASEFSPHNYLEKIFQIPYRVPGMTADGFESLIHSHAPVVEMPGEQVDEAILPTVEQPLSERLPVADAAPMAIGGGEEEEEEAATGIEAVAVSPLSPEFGLQSAERDFLAKLHAFAPTPRLVKRLLNAYALLRLQVSMSSGQRAVGWNAFLGGGHRAAALLLAMDIGFPVATRLLRHALISQQGDLQELLGALVRQAPKGSEARRQCADLAKALRNLPNAPSRDEVARWLEAVGRFCFHEPCTLDALRLENAVRPAAGG